MGVKLTRDELRRDVKLLIDHRGLDPTSAEARLQGACLSISVAGKVARSQAGQVAALVAAATAARTHRGGVTVQLEWDPVLQVRWRAGARTLSDALRDVGASIAPPTAYAPYLAIGPTNSDARGLGVVLDGSRAGCAPLWHEPVFNPSGFALGAAFGGSLAVLELFRERVLEERDAANEVKVVDLLGKREVDIRELERALPARLAFLGLGHLGQAALFVASLIGSRDDARTYVLLDKDHFVAANPSTQILATDASRGLKTAVCAGWLADRNISSKERKGFFTLETRREPDDPDILLVGLDNPEGRRALEAPGYRHIVDAGIGAGAATYAGFKVHTFPASRKAEDVFLGTSPLAAARQAVDLADRYASFAEAKDDECGARDVAGTSVGVPFVGTAVAALSLTQVLLFATGIAPDEIIAGDLTYTDVITGRVPRARAA